MASAAAAAAAASARDWSMDERGGSAALPPTSSLATKIVYRRLKPIHVRDSGWSEMYSERAVLLEVPTYPADKCKAQQPTPRDKRVALQSKHHAVYAHSLFPVVPHLPACESLPASIWTSSVEEARHTWLRSILPAHYEHYQCDAYTNDALSGEERVRGLGIFGPRENPLEPIIWVCAQAKQPTLLLHYVCFVTLQYYMCKRQAFMRVRTDANARHFGDDLPPFAFALLPSTDLVLPAGEPEGELAVDNVEERVQTEPFLTFLWLVLRWMQRTYPKALPETSKAEVKSFCRAKLLKNFSQTLLTSRFRELLPVDVCDRIAKSLPPALAATPPVLKFTKHFQHPKCMKMKTVELASKVPDPVQKRMARFYTHVYFRPDIPVLTAHDLDRGTHPVEYILTYLWQLLIYAPLSDFERLAGTDVTKQLQTAYPSWDGNLLPPSAHARVAHYDCMHQNQHQRMRYCMYSRDNHAYLYVPTLMVPDGLRPFPIPPVSETDPRHITREAWTWMCNVGTVYHSIEGALRQALHLGRVAHGIHEDAEWELLHSQRTGHVVRRSLGLTRWEHWVVGHQLWDGAKFERKPIAFMHGVQLLTGREEDGIASVSAVCWPEASPTDAWFEFELHAGALNWSQQAHEYLREDAALCSSLESAMAAWDRCSLPPPLPPPHTDRRAFVWDLFFQPSHVLLQESPESPPRPWIDFFQPTPLNEHIAYALSVAFDAAFDNKDVMREMRKLTPAQLSPKQLEQLLAIDRLGLIQAPKLRELVHRLHGSAPALDDFALQHTSAQQQGALVHARNYVEYNFKTYGAMQPMHLTFLEGQLLGIFSVQETTDAVGALLQWGRSLSFVAQPERVSMDDTE